MSLKKQLQDDLRAAMLARDNERKSALRMILASIQYAEVESAEDLSDEDVVTLLAKEIRRREEALEMMHDAGRTDLATGETAELDILKAYMPKQLTLDDIKELATAVIAQVGATSPSDLGQVMKHLMPQVKGKADGRTVNQVVRDLLSA